MNEIIVTLIASAFGTGGIAGAAALINLGGKHRRHKQLERLSETEQLLEDDETVKNSLIAARRVIATEIATSVLVRSTLGRYLLWLVPLTAIYVYLFWVMLDFLEDFPAPGLYRSIVVVAIVFLVYIQILGSITQHGSTQRALQDALLRHELSADEIIKVIQEMDNQKVRWSLLGTIRGLFGLGPYQKSLKDILRDMGIKKRS